MLQLSSDELLSFQENFPTLDPIQLMLLIRLVEVGTMVSYDFYNIFMGGKNNVVVQNEDMNTTGVFLENFEVEPTLKLEILEQPPDKCVYKRNVKPNPSVSIVGDLTENDGSLYVAPVLVRCDTFLSEPKHLTGNDPIKVGANRNFAFKKLKILVTSRQLNETHFSVRFELRKYSPNMNDYTVIHQVTSNPICVYSHSTQLKPTPKTKPTLTEIIPNKGSPKGQTRVAILGNNFVDSPTTRVKFDDIEVMPIFHGPRTLICHTPNHLAGKVKVQVCNEPDTWSNCGTFVYDTTIDQPLRMVGSEFSSLN
jgi:hypothetical protein